jgi:dienelactone hydrolase
MTMHYQHLGAFSDWVDAAQRRRSLYPIAAPGPATRQQLREVLGFCGGPEAPQQVQVERVWEQDGLTGEEISWWVGYGPRTHAYVLKPAGAREALPGIVALHDHSGFKWFGKEKIADGPEAPHPSVVELRACYGDRAYANALAREGFVVLIHDTFLWGSRRFPLADIPAELLQHARADLRDQPYDEIVEYNQAAGHHELLIEKYCALLGTTMAGVVSFEDRVALNYLRSRPDVATDRVGCLGLSGGGNRTALLLATHEAIQAAVIVGLMSTYAELLDRHVLTHTWMFFPHGWARYGDWPDIAAARAPMPLLVQYDMEDDLFSLDGMRAADRRIAAHYQHAGAPAAYTGQFYPGIHKFDREMQSAAFDWLKQQLGAS